MIRYLAFLLLTTSTLLAQDWTFGVGPPGCDGPKVTNHPRDSRVALLLHSNYDAPFLTIDGGVQWKRLDSILNFEYLFREVHLIFTYDEGVVIAFAVDTSIARSTDLGETWTWTPSKPQNGKLRALENNPFEPNTFIVSGISSDVRDQITRDGGNTWERIRYDGYENGLTTSEIVYAPSEPGLVYSHYKNSLIVSKDGGRSFQFVPHPSLNLFSASSLIVDPINAQRVYLVERFQLAVTQDGGKSWSAYKLPVKNSNASVVKSTKDTGVIWASDTALYRSSDHGSHWTKINEPWSGRDLSVGELNGNVTVSIPSKGLFTTHDLGTSWQRVDTNIRARKVDRIFMRDDSHWIVQCDSEVLRTSDAGRTWVTILRDGGIPGYNWLSISGLATIDNWDTLFVSALPFGYVTHNGETWKTIKRPIGFSGPLHSINWHRDNPNDILANVSNGLARSRDGGLTWINQPVPEGFEGSELARGSASSTTFMKSIKENYSLGVSNDDGKTWASVYSPEVYSHGVLAHRNCNDCFYHINSGMGSGGISVTKTAGKDWTRIFAGIVSKGHVATDPVNADVIYIYTIEGTILRFNANTMLVDTLFAPSTGPLFRTPAAFAHASTSTTFLVSTFRGLQRLSLSPTSVSTAPVSTSKQLLLSPTPAVEYLNVRADDPLAKYIELTSLEGVVVRRIAIDQPSAVAEGIRIPTDDLVPGVYGVRVGNAFGFAVIVRSN